MRQTVRILLVPLFLLTLMPFVWAQTPSSFKTKYTTVYYTDSRDLDDFIWRLGGRRQEFSTDNRMAMNRIDRLVERVQSILDMWPRNFHLEIVLRRGLLREDKVALYDKHAGDVQVSVDYASDGVVAHEIAHAVISRTLPGTVSSKVQEILAQYVDKFLWSDY